MLNFLSSFAWLGILTALLLGGVALLPDGADYPFPVEIVTATRTLWSWALAINQIFPIDTLAVCAGIGILVFGATRIAWPLMLWLYNSLTGR